MAPNIYNWSNEEILAAASKMGTQVQNSRIVGVYYEGSIDAVSFPFAGVGGEIMSFVGVDTVTGEKIVSHYAGVSISAGASLIPGTNVGGGAFAYTGEADTFGGWSLGAQLSAGNTKGASVNIDGSGTLYFSGNNTSLGFTGSGGYTYRVVSDGQVIYNFGKVEIYDYSFSKNQYDLAMVALLNSPRGEVEISYEVDGYIFTQTFQRVDNGNSYRVNVFEKVTDKSGNSVSDAVTAKYSSGKVWQFEISGREAQNISSIEHCFPSGTLITLADGSTKPIEDIRHGDIVLSHDKSGNLVPQTVDKLFTNTTDAFIRLTFEDNRDDLIATPGHHFLTETGDYMEIGHMARLGGGSVRIVDTDGSIVIAKAERIIYNAAISAQAA